MLTLQASPTFLQIIRTIRVSLLGLLSLFLISCGGGSGTVGTATGNALFTSAASSITIPTGSVNYSIGGGTATYKSTSSNPSVATTSVNGTNLNIVGVASGVTQITVTDAAGATVVISVTIGTGTNAPDLYVTAPSAINLAVSSSSTYTIAGGKPAYIVSSSNTAVASVGMNGNAFVVTGNSAGTAQIVIFDSTGSSVNVTVTVGAGGTNIPLFTTASSALTLELKEVGKFTAGGGTGPYSTTSSNTSIVTTSVSGNTVNINGISNGTAQVLVFDSTGASVTIAVTVGSSGSSTPLFTVAPSTVNLNVNSATISYSIGGGKAPYKAATSNTSVVTASITDSTLNLKGLSIGSEQVLVFDSLGASVTIGVNVGNNTSNVDLYIEAANAITLPANSSGHTFKIGGGSPTYSVTTSNPSVATVSISSNTLTINALTSGSSQIIVFDSLGKSASLVVTTGSSSTTTPLYVTSASAVTFDINESNSYTIGGGNGSYSASSSNNAIATATIANNVLTINGVSAGTTQILVFDSVGSSVTIGVTVIKSGNLQISVQPDGSTGNVGDALRFVVSGGTPSYTVTVNNPSIASVSPSTVTTNGASFTATLLNAGSTSILVTDVNGLSTSITVIASQLSASLRLSPNALTISEDNVSNFALNIYGGTAPYTVFTSDQRLVSVSNAGSIMNIGLGTTANRCINPIDSAGTHIPFGTFDITLTVVDSLGASATSILTIKDNGVGAGTVTTQPGPFAPPCT